METKDEWCGEMLSHQIRNIILKVLSFENFILTFCDAKKLNFKTIIELGN